jgi:hypothetical protein
VMPLAVCPPLVGSNAAVPAVPLDWDVDDAAAVVLLVAAPLMAGVRTVAPNNPPAASAPSTDAAKTPFRGVFMAGLPSFN